MGAASGALNGFVVLGAFFPCCNWIVSICHVHLCQLLMRKYIHRIILLQTNVSNKDGSKGWVSNWHFSNCSFLPRKFFSVTAIWAKNIYPTLIFWDPWSVALILPPMGHITRYFAELIKMHVLTWPIEHQFDKCLMYIESYTVVCTSLKAKAFPSPSLYRHKHIPLL